MTTPTRNEILYEHAKNINQKRATLKATYQEDEEATFTPSLVAKRQDSNPRDGSVSERLYNSAKVSQQRKKEAVQDDLSNDSGTFSPQITEVGKNVSTEGDFASRLHENASVKKQNQEELKEKFNENFAYQPQLNVEPTSSDPIERYHENQKVISRLYADSQARKEKIRKQRQELKLQEKGNPENTFLPIISPRASEKKNEEPIHNRLHQNAKKIEKNKQKKSELLKQESAPTFAPQLNVKPVPSTSELEAERERELQVQTAQKKKEEILNRFRQKQQEGSDQVNETNPTGGEL